MGEWPALDLAVHQRAQQAVVGMGALLLDLALEVRLDRPTGRDALLFHLLERVGLRADRVVAPRQELRQAVLGEAHQREEDRRRQRGGEVLVEITATPARAL